jgi:ADP-heptose:LPS heptosyltransferase
MTAVERADGPHAVADLRNVRKIAVLRANGLGDLMFALPALEALRAAYPEAELVLLARHWHAEFWDGRPGPVDRVIELPPLRGVSVSDREPAPSQLPAAFAAGLRDEAFDVALQLHGGGRYSNPLVRGLGARVTAGLRTPDAAPLDLSVPYFLHQPEVMRYLEVASLLGAPPVTLQPRVRVTGRDLQEADRALPAASRLVAIHVGASDPRRRLPPSKFALLADRLAARGWRITFTGAIEEAPLVAEVMRRMDRPASDLSGRLSVGGLAGLLSRCALVIGNDTGPLHLAAAVGVPTVGVYWLPNLIIAGPLARSSHRACVSWQIDCPVCGVRNIDVRCPHDDSFVAEVPVEDLLTQSLDLLGRSES